MAILFPATTKQAAPAIGGSYGYREIAIVEKYWTFHAMDSTLKVSITTGSQRSHRSHSRAVQGRTLGTIAIKHTGILGLSKREVTWTIV
jgi:hypothetical protein